MIETVIAPSGSTEYVTLQGAVRGSGEMGVRDGK
jgi:hypothetical protein